MRTVFLAICLASFFCCKNRTAPASPEVVTTASGEALPADFMAFYDKFLTDTAYQMAHIQWPLQGMDMVGSDADLSYQNVYWEPSQWETHQPTDLSNGEFAREFKTMGDVLVIETIRSTQANFGMERRFAKVASTDWSLIYYADMHEIKK